MILGLQSPSRRPVAVNLQLAGEDVHVADAWQEWFVRYDSTEEESLSSSEMRITIKWQLGGKTFGTKSYTRVRIPTKWLGGLHDWGTEVKVQTSADIYLGLPNGGVHVGWVETMPWLFSMGDASGKVVYPEFWICGSQDVVNELKAQCVGTENDLPILKFWPLQPLAYDLAYGRAFLNIESLLNEMEGRYSEFRLYVEAKQKWSAVQWPGVETASKTYDIPFEAPFNLKKTVTYTPSFTVTGGWTTKDGTPGITIRYSYTLTITEATYTLRSTTVTVTRTTTTVATSDFIPVPQPNLWKWLQDWLLGVVKANPWIMLVLIVLAVLIGLIFILLIVKALRWAAASPSKEKR